MGFWFSAMICLLPRLANRKTGGKKYSKHIYPNNVSETSSNENSFGKVHLLVNVKTGETLFHKNSFHRILWVPPSTSMQLISEP